MPEAGPPMRSDSKATMREVAQRAGVALSSVSRVLSGHPAVSESLRRRVLTAVSEMDYEPDFTAMSLRRGSTMTVAFLVRDIASPLFSDLVKSAERELRRLGYSLLLMNSDGDPDRDAAHIRLFARRRVDGLILSLASENHPETLAALKSLRAPVVLIDRRVPEIRASAVLSDHYRGLRAATKYLAEKGHQRIALITGPSQVLASRERVRGYKSGLRSAGIPADVRLLRIGSYSVEFGTDQVTQLLREPNPPTAVIAGAVMLSYGALQAIRRLGLSVPEDVDLVSCDPWPFPELFEPALTVVRRDATQMGRTAADLVIQAITAGTFDEIVLPTELVIGSGSRTPASR